MNRTGKPGAVPATELQAGQYFRYDTCDAVASVPEHYCLQAVDSRGLVKIRPFCDASMSSWLNQEQYVFVTPQEKNT